MVAGGGGVCQRLVVAIEQDNRVLQQEDDRRLWFDSQLARRDNKRWPNETTRQQDNEREACQEATQQPAGVTRG